MVPQPKYLVMHRRCVTQWMAKIKSPFPYGDSPYGKREADKKITFGDSPFPYGVCDHLGTNTYTKLTLLPAKVFFNCSRVQGPTKNK